MKKLKALWAKVPTAAKTEGLHVALVFAVTFVVTAAPAFPALVKQLQLGSPPDFSVLSALIVASTSAGLKAAIPIARALIVLAVTKYIARLKNKKALNAAFQEFLIARAAAQAAPVGPHIPGPDGA